MFGSFYNVVGYRLPNKMSIVFPQSHCPSCNHKLNFYELIPVLSYIFLGGKCKNCKCKISFFYPFFELLTGVLFLLCYLAFGINIEFFISLYKNGAQIAHHFKNLFIQRSGVIQFLVVLVRHPVTFKLEPHIIHPVLHDLPPVVIIIVIQR